VEATCGLILFQSHVRRYLAQRAALEPPNGTMSLRAKHRFEEAASKSI
jgi:hypothetical protein